MLGPAERAPHQPSPSLAPLPLVDLSPAVMADDPCEAALAGAHPTGPRKYYRARYYDPKVGRFLSEDPVGFIDGPNMYAYVRNNPVRYVDPWGLASCECPPKQKDCLELLFKQPVGNVKIVTKPPNKKWKATTRKNKIIVYGECDDLFEDPELTLEEYYHVLEQWKKKRFFKIRYGVRYLFEGYDNKYEKEAWKWVDQNLQAYLDCLAGQK